MAGQGLAGDGSHEKSLFLQNGLLKVKETLSANMGLLSTNLNSLFPKSSLFGAPFGFFAPSREFDSKSLNERMRNSS